MGDHLKSANEYIKDVRREQELRVRLRKIEALVDGGATEGERRAAQTKAKAIRSRLEKVQAKIQVMDQDEMHRQDYLDRARENYFFTREPEHLAVYLEAGGEIDDQVRAEIIERLRKGKPSKKGSSDPFGDIVVYEAIRKIRMEQTYEIFAIYDELENARQSGDNRTVEELLQGLPPEINLKDARQMYMDNIDEKIEDDTLRAQYDRGRKLVGAKNENEKRKASKEEAKRLEEYRQDALSKIADEEG